MKCISYKEGYKYQLVQNYEITIDIKSDKDITSDYIDFYQDGKLVIKKSYAWDGPSGPIIDTLNFIRGSLVHDALYQLMRDDYLNKDQYREQADQILQEFCKLDGMNALYAW